MNNVRYWPPANDFFVYFFSLDILISFGGIYYFFCLFFGLFTVSCFHIVVIVGSWGLSRLPMLKSLFM